MSRSPSPDSTPPPIDNATPPPISPASDEDLSYPNSTPAVAEDIWLSYKDDEGRTYFYNHAYAELGPVWELPPGVTSYINTEDGDKVVDVKAREEDQRVDIDVAGLGMEEEVIAETEKEVRECKPTLRHGISCLTPSFSSLRFLHHFSSPCRSCPLRTPSSTHHVWRMCLLPLALGSLRQT